LREVAAQQVADAGVIVDDDDAVRSGVDGRVHGGLQICNNGIVQAGFSGNSVELTVCYN
jgi:hypothetical protein